jgi:hypothetical protein
MCSDSPGCGASLHSARRPRLATRYSNRSLPLRKKNSAAPYGSLPRDSTLHVRSLRTKRFRSLMHSSSTSIWSCKIPPRDAGPVALNDTLPHSRGSPPPPSWQSPPSSPLGSPRAMRNCSSPERCEAAAPSLPSPRLPCSASPTYTGCILRHQPPPQPSRRGRAP